MNKILLIASLFAFIACNSKPGSQNTQKRNQPAKPSLKQEPVVDNSIKFDNYCNARFGFCIDYPKDIIYPQPESYNGDGRVFKNKHGDEVLTVFGRRNTNPDGKVISLEQQYSDDLHGAEDENGNKDRVLTYQKLNKTFFIISGYRKGKIFYQKTIVKDESFAYAILQYDEAEKGIFDKVSERIFKSFK